MNFNRIQLFFKVISYHFLCFFSPLEIRYLLFISKLCSLSLSLFVSLSHIFVGVLVEALLSLGTSYGFTLCVCVL